MFYLLSCTQGNTYVEAFLFLNMLSEEYHRAFILHSVSTVRMHSRHTRKEVLCVHNSTISQLESFA